MLKAMRTLLTLLLASITSVGALAQTALEQQSKALARASDAVVGVQVTAVEDARSAATLGRERQGSGVVISADGLVLTIGYLILEAEQVQLFTDSGRSVPARVLAYDLASGFGLVQALVPLQLAPVPLGSAAALRSDEPLMIASGGNEGQVSAARLVSRRSFSGYWEYHIEGALFTSPPRRDHSGAGLFNPQGELVGIGSLVVSDANEKGAPRIPGNMFVPIDLLKPILAELRTRGSAQSSTRAWVGLNCVEQAGAIQVVRVSEDSPADVAGLQAGDRILRIDGTEVKQLEQLWKVLWSGAGAQREVVFDVQRDGQVQTFKVFSVDRSMTLRRPQGV